jgi:hypothetical protein
MLGVLRILGPKRDEVRREWRKQHMRNLMTCIPHQIFGWSNRECAGHVAPMGERTGFWWGNLRERDHVGDTDLDGRIILRDIFMRNDVGAWTGLIWLRIG